MQYTLFNLPCCSSLWTRKSMVFRTEAWCLCRNLDNCLKILKFSGIDVMASILSFSIGGMREALYGFATSSIEYFAHKVSFPKCSMCTFVPARRDIFILQTWTTVRFCVIDESWMTASSICAPHNCTTPLAGKHWNSDHDIITIFKALFLSKIMMSRVLYGHGLHSIYQLVQSLTISSWLGVTRSVSYIERAKGLGASAPHARCGTITLSLIKRQISAISFTTQFVESAKKGGLTLVLWTCAVHYFICSMYSLVWLHLTGYSQFGFIVPGQ